MQPPKTSEEFSQEVEGFFLRVCRQAGPRSAPVGVAATLDAVAIAFRRIGGIFKEDTDPLYRNTYDYWTHAAQQVEDLKGKI